jgi:hypothetical protein
MTFKLAVSEKYWCPVHAELPGENGQRMAVKFAVQFKRLSQDDVRDFALRTKDAMEDAQESRASPTEVSVMYLMEIMSDWKELIDEDNAPLPFNRDNLTKLVDLGLGGAIYKTFYESQPRSREKNS